MIVLGIESSCDETGVGVYCQQRGLIGHALHSQIAVHVEHGGVVPELASRNHVQYITPLVKQALEIANVRKSELSAVAYTRGPGLIGALLVGCSFARSLAYGLGIPSFGVHHLEGHLLAPMLEDTPPPFPFVALLVSGGHTQLMLVRAIGDYELLGETLDDACGEAFDKTAKLLGLGMPGGPALAALAEQGDSQRFTLSKPMVNRPGMDFSFSGLKTQVLTTWQASVQDAQCKADLAAAFQATVVETLRIKCQRALEHTGMDRLVVAGGVGANKKLRAALQALMQSRNGEVYYPRPQFCVDNGAMIALCGYYRLQHQRDEDLAISARARWPLSELQA